MGQRGVWVQALWGPERPLGCTYLLSSLTHSPFGSSITLRGNRQERYLDCQAPEKVSQPLAILPLKPQLLTW